jgi:N-acetyltransferase
MVGMIFVKPVILTGNVVRLEPLTEGHVAGLTAVGLDDNIWQYLPYGLMRNEADIHGWVQKMLDHAENGTDLPFVVFHIPSGRVAGTTRYMEIRPEHDGLEIGGTWYGSDFRRTRVNTECKYLLLKHAFEELKCIRVQLKTDSRNQRSQLAIERIGAVKEGELRNHMVLPDGYIRKSIYYSILDSEWPMLKIKLEEMLTE